MEPDPDLYRTLAERFPDAVIEDAALDRRPAARRCRGAERPAQLRRAHPLAGRRRRAAGVAALAEHQAVAVRADPAAAGVHRGLRAARHPHVRRRPVRARPRPPPHPGAGQRLLPRYRQRRGAVGLQPGRAQRRPAAQPAARSRPPSGWAKPRPARARGRGCRRSRTSSQPGQVEDARHAGGGYRVDHAHERVARLLGPRLGIQDHAQDRRVDEAGPGQVDDDGTVGGGSAAVSSGAVDRS